MFCFFSTPTEVNDEPAIVVYPENGGDPVVVARIKAVHRPDDLAALINAANTALAKATEPNAA